MRKRTKKPAMALVAAIILAAGCANATDKHDRDPSLGSVPGTGDDEQLAITELAGKLAVDTGAIEVVYASSMKWPDSSLGCPRPGVDYLQVVTPGSMVLLRAGTTVHRVHVGGNRAIVCDISVQGGSGLDAHRPAGAQMRALMQKASTDLAQRLGISASEITISMVESVTWPDASLGCTGSGLDSGQTKIAGFRISLDYDDRIFNYHTDQRKVIPCPAIESQ